MNYKREMKRFNEKRVLFYTIVYLFLLIWAFFVMLPFVWMLITSLKSSSVYNSEIVPSFFIKNPTLSNYQMVFQTVSIVRYMFNTFIFGIFSTLIMLFITIPASFAFARLEFKGKKIVFLIFLSMMMVPQELIIITNYINITKLNMRNTYVGLIMPSVLSIFYIYLLKESFESVPDSLYMAAKMDGTSDFNYMMKILVPLAKPTILSISILKLIECFNSYAWPRLISTDKNYYLVSNGMELIKSSGVGKENIPMLMASVVIVSLPLILLFLIFRRQIMNGVSRSGLKG